VRDKYTGEVIDSLPVDYRRDLRNMIHQAYLARQAVQALSWDERLALIHGVGEQIAAHRGEIISLSIREAGQPRKFATWEVDRTVEIAHTFDTRLALLRPRVLPARQGDNVWVRKPYGVVGVVAPRNVPLVVPFYTISCALGSGNAVVVKPSSAAPLITKWLVDIFREAGAPRGAVHFTTCPGADTAWEFVENPELHVFVNYSSAAVGKDNLIKMGRHLESTKRQVGECRLLTVEGQMKKYVPELAGNDPFIVLDSANVEQAVSAGVLGGFANAGQMCIAAKRFLVARPVADAFRSQLVAAIRRLKMGNPADPDTDIGPIGDRRTLDVAAYQVKEALQYGGRLLVGGEARPPFFSPTLIEFDKEVVLDKPATEQPFLWVEESFAPLRSLVVFDTVDEALALANDTVYGLGGSVFGAPEEAKDVAIGLDAARVMINESPLYGDDTLPIGGIKDSGINGAMDKIEEMTYVKRIHVGQLD
jgi:acyl-CoA reductase-like NAD-dependent aldehyde dehydrogenase